VQKAGVDMTNQTKSAEERVAKLTGAESVVRFGVAKAGGQWYKDESTGTAYRVEGTENGKLVIKETRESKAKKEITAKRMTIECTECGAEREVATQDAFQVTRCADCQKKHRNIRRAQLAKRKRAEHRRVRELARLDGESAKNEEKGKEKEKEVS